MAAFTATLKRRARALHADGHGCNAIARELGLAPATISAWAKAEGLHFDRRQTALAVRAHTIDLRKDALLLAQKLVVAAHDTVDQLDGSYTLRELGRGPEGEGDRWVELEVDDAPVEVRVKAMTSVGIAIDKALKVIAASPDEGRGEAESLLDSLAEGFERAAADYEREHPQ